MPRQTYQHITLHGQTIEDLRREIQLELRQFGARLDQLAGARGTPTFLADINTNNHRLTQLGAPVSATDAQRVDHCLAAPAPGRDFDAKGRRIINVLDAEDASEAVNLDQLRNELTSLVVSNAALNAPPEVEDAGALGTVLERFALEDHTHSGMNLSDAQTASGVKTFSNGISFGNETLATYDENTFTVTGTGFSVNPTGTARYMLLEKLVVLWLPMLTGTSNVATFTLTGIPAAIQPTQNLKWPCQVLDNGAASWGVLNQVAASSVFTMHVSPGVPTWTDSGTKQLDETVVVYYLI